MTAADWQLAVATTIGRRYPQLTAAGGLAAIMVHNRSGNDLQQGKISAQRDAYSAKWFTCWRSCHWVLPAVVGESIPRL